MDYCVEGRGKNPKIANVKDFKQWQRKISFDRNKALWFSMTPEEQDNNHHVRDRFLQLHKDFHTAQAQEWIE